MQNVLAKKRKKLLAKLVGKCKFAQKKVKAYLDQGAIEFQAGYSQRLGKLLQLAKLACFNKDLQVFICETYCTDMLELRSGFYPMWRSGLQLSEHVKSLGWTDFYAESVLRKEQVFDLEGFHMEIVDVLSRFADCFKQRCDRILIVSF